MSEETSPAPDTQPVLDELQRTILNLRTAWPPPIEGEVAHTPEPWIVHGQFISTPEFPAHVKRTHWLSGKHMIACMNRDREELRDGMPLAVTVANGRRLVKCVTACKGVADPAQVFQDHAQARRLLAAALEALKKARDAFILMQKGDCYRSKDSQGTESHMPPNCALAATAATSCAIVDIIKVFGPHAVAVTTLPDGGAPDQATASFLDDLKVVTLSEKQEVISDMEPDLDSLMSLAMIGTPEELRTLTVFAAQAARWTGVHTLDDEVYGYPPHANERFELEHVPTLSTSMSALLEAEKIAGLDKPGPLKDRFDLYCQAILCRLERRPSDLQNLEVHFRVIAFTLALQDEWRRNSNLKKDESAA